MYSGLGVYVERVTFSVDGLKESGRVCRPLKAGPFRVLVLAHGGFSGLNGGWQDPYSLCATIARAGWAVVAPSYRGEDTSEGKVEVCRGEVDDTLTMLGLALNQNWADRARVAMLGMSHGGCVVLRALERGAQVDAAVSISGVTDWSATDRFLRDGFRAGGPDSGEQAAVLNAVEVSIGGSSDQLPEAYRERSPLTHAADLAARDTSLLLIHGVADQLVPIDATCEFASTSDFIRYHLDAKKRPVASAPATCGSGGPRWEPGALPLTTWPGKRYLVALDGARHYGDAGKANTTMMYIATMFLSAKVPAPSS